MSEQFGSETIEGIANAAQQQQVEVTVDENNVKPLYSPHVNVWGTPEEVYVDFTGGLRPTGNRTATMKIEQRIALSPFAAKRLAIQLGQWISRYEATYGMLELDERKRRVMPANVSVSKPN